MRIRYRIASGIGRVRRAGRSKNPSASTFVSSSAATAAGNCSVSTADSLLSPASPPLWTILIRKLPLLLPGRDPSPRLDAHHLPGVADDVRCLLTELLLRGRRGLERRVGEVRARAQAPGQGVVPDRARLLPGVSAQMPGEQIEGVIRYPGIDVDAAVVVRGLDVVLHVPGLRILSDPRIVVGGSRPLHRAQRATLHALGEQPRADQPVRAGGGLVPVELLD